MKKVLLIEDNKVTGKILQKKITEEADFEVVWALCLSEAKAVLGKEENFFAAIVDFSLPDALRGEAIGLVVSHNVPAIIFTGSMDADVRDFVWSHKVVDYVLKTDRSSLDYIISWLYRLESNKNIKVLVVDDSALFRKFIADLLQVHQYHVLTAGDGDAALSVLQEHPDIKLVITDFQMPHIDGYQLTEEIRKTHSKDDLGIIGISSVSNSSTAAHFIKNGANDFIVKQSFVIEEFYSRVSQCIENNKNIKKIQEINELKNKFLGMAAHDLRNPLSSIRGFSELLLEGGLDEDTASEFTSLIHSTSENMLVLLNDLLDISVIESGKFVLNLEKGDLLSVVERQVYLARSAASKKGMGLVTQLDSASAFVFDSGKISQAIDNLLGNAIKYSPQDSTICIRLENQDDSIKFCVRDQGPGISPDEKHKLFGEFSRLSSQPTGDEKSTGLGLAITKKIIKEHGGKIGVECGPGKGALFFFSLPTKR